MPTQTADRVLAKNSDAKFKPHPADQFPALCVDVIDLGERVEDYIGKPKRLSPKCAIVFRTGARNEETGELIDISGEYTVSLGEKANLRKVMEQWRGKAYTPEQIEEGVAIERMVGNWALVTVAHKKSQSGRVYAIIQSAVPLPKQMRSDLPEFPEYERAPFWAERKKEYLDVARKFRAEIGAPAPDEDHNYPDAPEEEEDDLPF